VGGNELRTVESAAAQVGATMEEIEALVAGGRLRVLAGRDGRWITTARAVSDAVQAVIRRPAGERARRAHRARRVQRRRAAVATVVAAPRRGQPVVPVMAPAAVVAQTSTPRDLRPDIAGDRRLDLHAAAAHLGIGTDAVLLLMRRGQLPATRLGREWVTSMRALAAGGVSPCVPDTLVANAGAAPPPRWRSGAAGHRSR
jgi:hypothetical protein